MQMADSTVDAAVDTARTLLKELGHNAEHWMPMADTDSGAAETLQITQAEVDALFAVARKLYVSKDYQRAVQVAVFLATCNPVNAHFSYLAGRCLQMLGQLQEAVDMYDASQIADEHHAPSALRRGECLRRLNRLDESRAAFEQALNLARGDESLRAVQDTALANLSR
jgi:tetratricopeptide (TPR) repeat protein